MTVHQHPPLTPVSPLTMQLASASPMPATHAYTATPNPAPVHRSLSHSPPCHHHASYPAAPTTHSAGPTVTVHPNYHNPGVTTHDAAGLRLPHVHLLLCLQRPTEVRPGQVRLGGQPQHVGQPVRGLVGWRRGIGQLLCGLGSAVVQRHAAWGALVGGGGDLLQGRESPEREIMQHTKRPQPCTHGARTTHPPTHLRECCLRECGLRALLYVIYHPDDARYPHSEHSARSMLGDVAYTPGGRRLGSIMVYGRSHMMVIAVGSWVLNYRPSGYRTVCVG